MGKQHGRLRVQHRKLNQSQISRDLEEVVLKRDFFIIKDLLDMYMMINLFILFE